MELWLALIALWTWECLAFVPPGGAYFALARGRPRVRRRAGLGLANLWPLRLCFTLDGLPFEATALQAVGAGPLSFLAATGTLREERAVSWALPVEANGAVVALGGKPLLRTSSDAAAERIAGELRGLAAAPVSERAVRARESLRNALSGNDVAARIARVRRATLPHRALSSIALLGIGVGIPVLTLTSRIAWGSVWENTWQLWIALHGLGFVALAIAELRLKAPGRGARLFRAAFYPPTQWRGSFELASAALGETHPLAAQRTFDDAPALLPWARRAIAESDHPRFDAGEPVDDAEAEARRAALRDRRAELLAFCERAGIGAQLAAPPTRSSPSAGSYCPRCFEEFVPAGWVCTDCGIETRPYGSAAPLPLN